MPQPEIIFSTYGPLSSLWLGGRLAKAWPSAVWVADFRDLVVGDFYPSLVNGRLAGLQRHTVARAEAVTAVSKGLQAGLVEDLPPELEAKVHVLPNGFEAPSDEAPPHEHSTDRILRIGYTGNMYAGRRDASALFQVLRELIDSGAVDPTMVEVHYAGKDSEVFLDQAASSGVGHVVVDHGFVGKEQALHLQAQSDILLVLSWNTSAQRGVLTGKLFEYLASGRPILALTGGDLPAAELTELVNELELGFAFEYVTGKADAEALRSFVLGAYERRQRRESLSLRSTDAIRAYEYETIARRLEALFVLYLSRRSQ